MAAAPKVFETILVDQTLIVAPISTDSSYRYQDVHLESNAVVRQLSGPDVQHVVIDLVNVRYAGSLMIGAMVRMARQVMGSGGRSAFCCVSPQMDEILRKMGMFKLWTACDTRDEAIEFVNRDGSDD